MARRRVKRPEPLARLAASYKARVRRTAEKVSEGKVALADVEADIRDDVDAKVKAKVKAKGGPG